MDPEGDYHYEERSVPEHKTHRNESKSGELDERTVAEIAERLRLPSNQREPLTETEPTLQGLPEKGTRHKELDKVMAKKRKKERKHVKDTKDRKKKEKKKKAATQKIYE